MTGDHGQPLLYIVQRGNREPALQRPLVLDHLVEFVEISGWEDMGKDIEFHIFSGKINCRCDTGIVWLWALGFGLLASWRAGKDGVALVVIEFF